MSCNIASEAVTPLVNTFQFPKIYVRILAIFSVKIQLRYFWMIFKHGAQHTGVQFHFMGILKYT